MLIRRTKRQDGIGIGFCMSLFERLQLRSSNVGKWGNNEGGNSLQIITGVKIVKILSVGHFYS